MTQKLYEIEEQITDINLKNISQSEAVTQDNTSDTIRTNSVPEP